MKACISYSFFGSDIKYVSGINQTIKYLTLSSNSHLRTRVSFRLHVYTNYASSDFLSLHIAHHPLLKIFILSSESSLFSVKRSWRYSLLLSPEIQEFDFCLFRDSDSAVNQMEFELIDKWLDIGTPYLVIRASSLHTWPIMAGLFAARSCSYSFLRKALFRSAYLISFIPDFYNLDQLILSLFVYPSIIDSLTVFTCLWYYSGECVLAIRESSSHFPGSYLSVCEPLCVSSHSLLLSPSESPRLCKAPPFLLALLSKFSVRFFIAWKSILSPCQLS